MDAGRVSEGEDWVTKVRMGDYGVERVGMGVLIVTRSQIGVTNSSSKAVCVGGTEGRNTRQEGTALPFLTHAAIPHCCHHPPPWNTSSCTSTVTS